MRKHHIAAVAAAAVLAAVGIPALTARASTSPNHLWMKQDISQGRESEEQIYVRKPKSPDKVTLSFAGDISFAEGYANMVYYHSNGDDITRCIAPEVIARIDAADIMMINNEFTYSTRGTPLSGKTFTFRAKPETAANLSILSADIVSLANNHVYDYGETALLDTMDTLKKNKIPYVGAGRNLEEAKEIVYFQAGDLRTTAVSLPPRRQSAWKRLTTDCLPRHKKSGKPDIW